MTKIIKPAELDQMLKSGECLLIDIRSADEFARESIPGAKNVPLDQLDSEVCPDGNCAVVFHCRSGMRTANAADKLNQWAGGEALILEGGLEAWRAAGLDAKKDTSAPLEINRQVQITAGSLILLGVILSLLVHPYWIGLSAFVGAGLTFAGISGTCAMANMLMLMPWNRRPA